MTCYWLVTWTVVSEELNLLMIGKIKNLRCFKSVKNLPVEFKANKNSYR
jgi:hypothetical protein